MAAALPALEQLVQLLLTEQAQLVQASHYRCGFQQ